MTGWSDLAVLADGAPLPDDGTLPVVGLRLLRRLNTPAELSLALRPADAGTPVPGFGAELSLRLETGTAFRGRIARLERRQDRDGPIVEITARDALADLSRQRRRSAGDHPSIIALVRDAAATCGSALHADGVGDFDIGRHLTRTRDDLAQLMSTLRRYGLAAAMRPRGLHLTDLSAAFGAPLVLGQDTGAVTAFREVEEPVAGGTAGTWAGWTPDTDQTVSDDAGPGDAPGLTGGAVRARDPQGRLAAAHRAEAAAEAHWIEATLEGLSDLWPGQDVSLPDGIAPVRARRVELLLDAADGARTLVSSRPGAETRPDASGPATLMTGQVRDAADPLRLGRVRVALNGHPGAVTGWLNVIAPHSRAGGGGGLLVPLDDGDPVALVAPEGDPEIGIVLGSLVRGGGAAGRVHSGAGRRQVWRGDAAEVVIDEAGRELRLALDDGTNVTLGPDGIKLRAASRLELDCDGQVLIRGSRIDFQEA